MSHIKRTLFDQNKNLPRVPSTGLLISLATLTAILLIIGGILIYNLQAQAIHERKADELKSIATLKVQQIVQWRQERLKDARMNSTSPFFDQAIDQWLSKQGDITLRTALIHRFQMIVDLEEYQNVFLTDPDGSLLLSLDPTLIALDAGLQQFAAHSSQNHEAILGEFIRNPISGKIAINIAAPILNEQKSTLAVLVLQVNPEKFLYPMIQSWPVPSQTAETLLIRREGQEALYLNILRFDTTPALTFQIPLNQTDVPAIQAALGYVGEFEGRDYRGSDVLAEILPVPGSSWVMVAKVDREELFSELRSFGFVVIFVVSLSVLMTIAIAAYSFNRRQRMLYQNLFQVERERREAQEETRTTLYSIGDGVITTDPQGRVTRLNPVAESLTGWSEQEAIGKPLVQVFQIISETTRLKIENPVERVLQEGRVVGLANHTLLIDRVGTQRPIADSSAPIWDADGKITGVVMVFRDQTEERAIQRERALLTYIITHSLDEIYLFDADDYHFRFVNEGAERNLGYTQKQLRLMTPVDIKPEYTIESFQRRVAPLSEGKIPILFFETVHQRADGSRYPVDVHLQLFEHEGERVFLAVINDITGRKQTEKILRESEARLERAQAVAHIGNWELNLADKSMWASAEAFRIYGLERTTPFLPLEQVQQIPITEERPRLDAALQQFIGLLAPYDLEFHIRRASDGMQRIVHSIAQLEYDANGQPTQVIGVIQDITERTQSEQALRESEERYRALFHNNHAVMFLIDPENGTIFDANPAAADFYGWSVEELIRKNISQINTLSEDAIQQEMLLASRTQRKSFQFQHRKHNGQVSDVEVFSGPIRLGGKTLLYSIVHDITERKHAEEKIAEQLEELRAWHTATLGREMRVLELKREVDDCLALAGLQPRYSGTEEGPVHE